MDATMMPTTPDFGEKKKPYKFTVQAFMRHLAICMLLWVVAIVSLLYYYYFGRPADESTAEMSFNGLDPQELATP